ncbi:glycosyltransferase family 32 protein [Coprobacter sp.]
MIPKVIHYCWFGKAKYPDFHRQCIEKWRVKLPDYTFKLWDESTFDVKSIKYTREAYKAGKYAFVSDYVRLHALYTEGGIYLDTDVEIIKTFDDLLHQNAFVGLESKNYISTAVMGSVAKGEWITSMLNLYKDKVFVLSTGDYDQTTNVVLLTKEMIRLNLFKNDNQNIVKLYSEEYFSPKSFEDGTIVQTDNTYAIHHFAFSWKKKVPYYKILLGKCGVNKLGIWKAIKRFYRSC